MNPEQPPEDDPYRAVWHMTPVGDAGRHGGRGGRELRIWAGVIAGLIGFFPFGLMVTAAWGFWSGDPEVNSGGFALLFVGLAAGACLGGYIASNKD